MAINTASNSDLERLSISHRDSIPYWQKIVDLICTRSPFVRTQPFPPGARTCYKNEEKSDDELSNSSALDTWYGTLLPSKSYRDSPSLRGSLKSHGVNGVLRVVLRTKGRGLCDGAHIKGIVRRVLLGSGLKVNGQMRPLRNLEGRRQGA